MTGPDLDVRIAALHTDVQRQLGGRCSGGRYVFSEDLWRTGVSNGLIIPHHNACSMRLKSSGFPADVDRTLPQSTIRFRWEVSG